MKPNYTPPLQTEFIVNGVATSDRNEIANEFNNYFTNIGTNLANLIPVIHTSPKHYLTASLDHSIFVTPVTLSEVRSYIRQLKQSTGPGPDLIYPAAIKAAETYITPSLTILINASLAEGIFPHKLKYARIAPILAYFGFRSQRPKSKPLFKL